MHFLTRFGARRRRFPTHTYQSMPSFSPFAAALVASTGFAAHSFMSGHMYPENSAVSPKVPQWPWRENTPTCGPSRTTILEQMGEKVGPQWLRAAAERAGVPVLAPACGEAKKGFRCREPKIGGSTQFDAIRYGLHTGAVALTVYAAYLTASKTELTVRWKTDYESLDRKKKAAYERAQSSLEASYERPELVGTGAALLATA